MKHRSTLFKNLRDETIADYSNDRWPYAKQWRARVGIPRLVADTAAGEASGLLGSIFKGIHQHEPELAQLLTDAVDAADAYAVALAQDNWAKFRNEK